MTTWVALLRGVNVGGHRKVPMARLRELCLEAGLEDVRTYIASGNLVLRSSHATAASVQQQLEDLLLADFGFDVDVVVRTGDQVRAVVSRLPFDDDDHVSLTFLPTALGAGDRKSLQAALLNDAEIAVVREHAYIRTPKGLGQPFLTHAGNKLLAGGTNRNWRTVLKLAAMADEVDDASSG